MCKIIYRGHIIYITLPTTYYNNSKTTIKCLAPWYKERNKFFFIKSYIYSTADNSESVI